MREFIKALIIFIRMYRDGFFWSDNTHTDSDGTRWGFWRFNHRDNCFAIVDIDFNLDTDGTGYWHLHGDDTRMDLYRKKAKNVIYKKLEKKRKR